MNTVKESPKITRAGTKATGLTRRDRARATRLRITKAAYELFCARGYAGTTMAEIAEAAGVAVQTVYFTFHTKNELLSRTYDFAVLGESEPIAPEQSPWYAAMVTERELRPALRHVVVGIGAIMARAAPLDVVVRAAAVSEPDTAKVRNFHERWRRQGYGDVLDKLTSKAPLRDGLTRELATDLLLLYLGDVYRVLVQDFGWTPQAWADWTVTAIAEQVFAPTA
jgi:AcrR family transcriptional regulator